MSTLTDHRPQLQAAYRQAGTVAATVLPGELSRPTPCTEYDLAALLDHLVFAARRAATLGRGEAMSDDYSAEHLALDAVPEAIREAADEAAASWTETRLTVETTMPWGMVYTGADLVNLYTIELVAHTWDVAHAVGRTGLLDEGLAELAFQLAQPLIPAEYRGEGMPFGPVVAVEGEADANTRFATFMGRNPRG